MDYDLSIRIYCIACLVVPWLCTAMHTGTATPQLMSCTIITANQGHTHNRNWNRNHKINGNCNRCHSHDHSRNRSQTKMSSLIQLYSQFQIIGGCEIAALIFNCFSLFPVPALFQRKVPGNDAEFVVDHFITFMNKTLDQGRPFYAHLTFHAIHEPHPAMPEFYAMCVRVKAANGEALPIPGPLSLPLEWQIVCDSLPVIPHVLGLPTSCLDMDWSLAAVPLFGTP